jgi:hypothetical protein
MSTARLGIILDITQDIKLILALVPDRGKNEFTIANIHTICDYLTRPAPTLLSPIWTRKE